MRRSSGFALVEVVIVICILGLLAAIAVLSFIEAKKNAEEAARIIFNGGQISQSDVSICDDENTCITLVEDTEVEEGDSYEHVVSYSPIFHPWNVVIQERVFAYLDMDLFFKNGNYCSEEGFKNGYIECVVRQIQ